MSRTRSRTMQEQERTMENPQTILPIWIPLHILIQQWYNLSIPRLVLETFVGPCPPGKECCHWDDDPSNNNLSNLRWGSHFDNTEDIERNGGRIKLNFEKARKIRKLH